MARTLIRELVLSNPLHTLLANTYLAFPISRSARRDKSVSCQSPASRLPAFTLPCLRTSSSRASVASHQFSLTSFQQSKVRSRELPPAFMRLVADLHECSGQGHCCLRPNWLRQDRCIPGPNHFQADGQSQQDLRSQTRQRLQPRDRWNLQSRTTHTHRRSKSRVGRPNLQRSSPLLLSHSFPSMRRVWWCASP